MSDTDLLDLAVEAHGGQTHWDEVSSIRIDVSITDAIRFAKGQPNVLEDVVMKVDTRQQRVLTTFVGQDRETVFEPGQIVIDSLDGRTEETRRTPRIPGPDRRRHDYTVDILGGATGLNDASEYREIDGLMFPTKRRVYAYEGDYQLVPEPLLVAVDISGITLL